MSTEATQASTLRVPRDTRGDVMEHVRDHRTELAAALGGAALVILAIVIAHVSIVAFAVTAAAILLLSGWAAYRWPQAMLVLVVMAPIVDLYIFGALVPQSVSGMTRFFSEAMLGVVGLVIAGTALRRGRFFAAFRNPLTLPMIVFVALALVSALLNLVPPHVAGAGLFFTLEAVTLFYLVLMAGFNRQQIIAAVAAFVGLVSVMAVLGIAQMVLAPDILGRPAITGRFGETVRIGSFIGSDVGLFGILVGMAVPYPLFAAFRVERPAHRWLLIGLSFVLMLALVLSFSRSSWLGVVIGFGFVALVLDRRVLLVAAVTGIVAFAIAPIMPRNLLVPSDPSTPPGTTTSRPDIVRSTYERTQAIIQGNDRRSSFLVNAVPIIRNHPVLGVGPGRYGGGAAWVLGSPVYEEYGTDRLLGVRQHAVDNFWLHLLVESGVLGLAAFAAGGIMLGIGLLKAARGAPAWTVVIIGGALAAGAELTVNGGGTMSLEANVCTFALWFLAGLAGAAAGWPKPADEPVSPSPTPAAAG